MERFLRDIITISELFSINTSSALFLVSVYYKMPVDVSVTDFSVLCSKCLIVKNNIPSDVKSPLEEILNAKYNPGKLDSSSLNITSFSKDTLIELSSIFMPDGIPGKELERLAAYNTENNDLLPFLYLFFQMFPIKDGSGKRNKTWEKHFGITWENVSLRILSKGSINKILKIFKSKDIGVFLFGTYLSIKESYNSKSNQYFIKKIENYLREWESWYSLAEDLLAESNNVKTKSNMRSNSSANTFVA